MPFRVLLHHQKDKKILFFSKVCLIFLFGRCNDYSVIGDIIRMIALYYLLAFVSKKNVKLPAMFLVGMAISFSSISLFAGINGHLIRAFSEGISTLVMLYILFSQS